MQDQFGREQSYMWHPITRETLLLDSPGGEKIPGGEKSVHSPLTPTAPRDFARELTNREFSGFKTYTQTATAAEREEMLEVCTHWLGSGCGLGIWFCHRNSSVKE